MSVNEKNSLFVVVGVESFFSVWFQPVNSINVSFFMCLKIIYMSSALEKLHVLIYSWLWGVAIMDWISLLFETTTYIYDLSIMKSAVYLIDMAVWKTW